MTSAASVFQSVESWDDVLMYIFQYGIQTTLVIVLSAVTVYRREMSCNRVFHDEASIESIEEDVDDGRGTVEVIAYTDERAYEQEAILDSAGLYCSGAPFVAIARAWIDGWEQVSSNHDRVTPSCDRNRFRANPWKEPVPEDLFDSVGNYYSGEPFVAAVAALLASRDGQQPCNNPHTDLTTRCSYARDVPNDVHCHIATFLHPRDLVSLACVSRSFRRTVNRGTSSMAMWKSLWARDYGWIVAQWDVGRSALERSQASPVFDRDFYFLFQQTYLNYVLAGQNTSERCLVGLHDNIYDITPFLHLHPGSPDTLMVHSGRDATSFFEDMGHSMGARRIARSLCVVVDRSCDESSVCGVSPTRYTSLLTDERDASSALPSLQRFGDDRICKSRKVQRKKQRSGTLAAVRERLDQERADATKRLQNMRLDNVLGHANMYYDPVRRSWRAWYTDTSLRQVFVGDL